MKKSVSTEGRSPSELIDERLAELGDWRGETLSRMRQLIREADPDVVEEWKWRGTPVWSHDGILCTGESYRSIVKLTFARGALLEDPARLFNASLEGNARRAIDIREGAEVDAAAFQALIRAAVALNSSRAKARARGWSPAPRAGPAATGRRQARTGATRTRCPAPAAGEAEPELVDVVARLEQAGGGAEPATGAVLR